MYVQTVSPAHWGYIPAGMYGVTGQKRLTFTKGKNLTFSPLSLLSGQTKSISSSWKLILAH